MKIIKYIIISNLIFFPAFCGKKAPDNKVPIEQINTDKSSNYQYILKDVIEKEDKRKEQEKKDPFKD